MKEFFKIIKENFFLLILLLGIGFFINGLFSFGSDSYSILGFRSVSDRISVSPELPSGVDTYPVAISTYYYYDYSARNNLIKGAVLIVLGLIKLRTKKDKK